MRLPGEVEAFTVRPHPSAWSHRFLDGLVPAFIGIVLSAMFNTAAWQAGPSWLLWGHQSGALALVTLELGVWGAARALLLRRRWPALEAAAILALVLAFSAIPVGYELSIPAGLVLGSVCALGVRIYLYASTRYVFTNLRVIAESRMPSLQGALLHDAADDVDRVATPGAFWGYRTLQAISGEERLTLHGVRHAADVQRRWRHLIKVATDA